MLFVLAGPSYVGKKTALVHFMKLYSFSSIIPYTTKPSERRRGEVEGIKYHYVDQADRADIENDDYIYDIPFQYKEQQDDIVYAYKKSDIENAIDSYANFMIHASVGNAMQIYDNYHDKYTEQLYVIFLNYEATLTKEFFREKFIKMDNRIIREDDTVLNELDEEEFVRRFWHAQKEREVYAKNSSKFDSCVKADHPYTICQNLEGFILPKLKVRPTSPDRIPGPLSDTDIMYMSEKRRNDNLEVAVNGKKLVGEELSGLLCGCGMHLTLSNTIRIIKKRWIHNYIDMSTKDVVLEKQLSKMYPEENIATGYVLEPHEVILCSSLETIKMPHDIYAIVSSKFSYTQLGLSIELGTSVIQAGHNGRIHFQIKNNTANSICIYPGIKVAQLLFFRTVQPSSKIYNQEDNYSYDAESISPISKFRKNNECLSNVHKPESNYKKTLLKGLQSKLLDKIIGWIITLTFIIPNMLNIQKVIDKYGPVFWKSMPDVVLGIIIVISVGLINDCMAILGKFCIYLFNKIWSKFREMLR